MSTTPLSWYSMIQNPATGLVLEVGAQIIVSRPTGAPNQLFMLRDGRLINKQTPQFVLDIGGATEGWVMSPSRPLDEILARPSVPFPAFTGPQGDAYGVICKSLGRDVRDAYGNEDMSTLRSDVAELRCPSSIPHDAWSAVTEQLSQEIRMAAAVRLVYDNLDEWYSDVFGDGGARLQTIIADAQVPPNSTVEFDAFSLFSGILYMLISAEPAAGSVLANLMSTGLNMAHAAQPLDRSFSSTLANLWTTLSPAFTAVHTALAQNLDAIVKDWGKLQAVAQLINSTGPNSLDLTATEDSTLAAKAGQAYGVTVLQTLMPMKWQIYRWRQTSNQAPYKEILGEVPSHARWVQPLGTGLYNVYVVAAGRGSFPSHKCMESDIWHAGVMPADFFTDTASWPFTINDIDPLGAK